MNQSLTDRLADRQSADGWELGLILLCSREVASGSFRYPAGTAPLLFERQKKKLLTRQKNLPPRNDVWREGNLPGSHLTNSKVTQPHHWDTETIHSTFAWFAIIHLVKQEMYTRHQGRSLCRDEVLSWGRKETEERESRTLEGKTRRKYELI